MNKLNTIIDIKFLDEHCGAFKEGIGKEIKEPIMAKQLIDKLLSTEEIKKLYWANSLLCSLFDKESALNYAIFAAEQVSPILENKYPNNNKLHKVLGAVEAAWVEDIADEDYTLWRLVDAAYAAAVSAVADYSDSAKKEMLLKIINYGIGLLEDKNENKCGC